MLRVIAGKFRSRHLKQPSSENIRPTKDRTKEAMFSTLMSKVEGAIVLDLFSGSGSLSIEAISRGAMKAIAVDNNRDAIVAIKKNIDTLGINNMSVIKSDVLSYLLTAIGTEFDLIFMDPPYTNIEIYNETLELLAKNKMIKNNGFIVVETSAPNKIEIPEGLALNKKKDYGKSSLLYISKNI